MLPDANVLASMTNHLNYWPVARAARSRRTSHAALTASRLISSDGTPPERLARPGARFAPKLDPNHILHKLAIGLARRVGASVPTVLYRSRPWSLEDLRPPMLPAAEAADLRIRVYPFCTRSDAPRQSEHSHAQPKKAPLRSALSRYSN
jgi:hypothetical protein